MDILFYALAWIPLESQTAIYTVLFSVLIISGFGVPIPEEATLLVGGYLVYLGILPFWPTIYILSIGIIIADTAGYLMGRFAGERVSEKVSRSRYGKAVLEKAEKLFEKHGEKMIFFSRPFVGVRVIVPIFAGHFRMNFAKFILYDTIAAIPWVFLLTSVSYYFGAGLDLLTEVKEIKHAIFAIGAAGALLWAARIAIQEKKKNGNGKFFEKGKVVPVD